MSKFVFHSTRTGQITKVVECNDEDASLNLNEGEGCLKIPLDLNVSDSTHYVNRTTHSLRLKNPVAGPREITMFVGERRIISLPENCLVLIWGDQEDVFEVDDGTLELEFSTPGEYTISFEMIHYIKPQVQVHVKED